MTRKIFITLSLFILALTSCDKVLLNEEVSNDPVSNFDYLWTEFNEKYGLFEPKSINWDSAYYHYRSKINTSSSEEELYAVLKDMLMLLQDDHVGLVPTNPNLPPFTTGHLSKIDSMKDFDLSVIKDHYLADFKFEEPFFTYGILEGNIGYIHIEGFSDMPKNLEKPMDIVLEHLKDTKGIIVDVRGGYGGEDLAGQYIAGRFTKEYHQYMKTRVKNGPGPNDFTQPEFWSINQEGDFQYTNSVVVLTHRFTISARETFCLAMATLPQVTFVGDTTAGAFSNQINREMPNGWGFSISIGQWTTANDISYEGIGIPPDILVLNKEIDLLAGKDEALEKAIELLN